MAEKEKLRLDKYLWAIRLFKTRAQAAAACDGGKVKCNGTAARAARPVKTGEEYEVKTEAKRWRIRVTQLLPRRVAYQESLQYYTDITPAEEQQRLSYLAAAFHTGKRRSKIGRPTKKDRRDLDEYFG